MMCLWNIGNNAALTNEEYRKQVESRIRLMSVLCFAGLLLLALGVCSEYFALFPASHQQSMLNGILTGMGSGIIAVCVVRIFRFRKFLRDEEALKLARLEASDERNKFIAQNALRLSAFVVLFACYVFMIIGGMTGNTVLFYSFFTVIMLFFISYLLLNVVLRKRI